jgi:hypothetical protein
VDPTVDLVDDRPDIFDRLAGRIVELPIEIALARIDRARIATPHGDDYVGHPGSPAGEGFRELMSGVETALLEDGHNRGIELVERFRPDRKDIDSATGVVFEQDAGRQAPSGVVDAEEQHNRSVAHAVAFDSTTGPLGVECPVGSGSPVAKLGVDVGVGDDDVARIGGRELRVQGLDDHGEHSSDHLGGDEGQCRRRGDPGKGIGEHAPDGDAGDWRSWSS